MPIANTSANTANSKSGPIKSGPISGHLYYQESFSVQEIRFPPTKLKKIDITGCAPGTTGVILM